MRLCLIASLAFHLTIALLAWLGLPGTAREPMVVMQSFAVEMVAATEPDLPEPKPEPEPPSPPPPPPKPPEPEPEPAPEPEPEPAPEPEPEPVPEPEPEPVPEPEPEPAPEPEPEARKEPPKPKPKPDPPEPAADFASVLKDLKRELEDEAPPPSLQDTVSQALEGAVEPEPQSALATQGALSMSELEAVRRQIAGCWNIPAGARAAEDMRIDVRIEVNPDRTVRLARLVEPEKAMTDGFWRAAAESALRAVLNPRCNPLKLPPEKYDTWRTIIFTFNPREMFG